MISEAMEFIHAESWRGSCLGLERMEELMDRLGNPQNSLRFIHVAGTNGKGSVCAMLSAILVEAGYKTGRFTSPYIEQFNERIRIDNTNISDDELIALVKAVKPHVEAMAEKPTEFELITAMSFLYFKDKGCDMVVLEVGLGGRLDSTNIIPSPEVAVIASIGIDHAEVLGDTIEEIAREKAGIIKQDAQVVLSQQDRIVENIIANRCKQLGVNLIVTEASQMKSMSNCLDYQLVHYRQRENLQLHLLGKYQCDNVMMALDTIDALKEKGYEISERAISRGLKAARWPGRFEVIRKNPYCILDGAHNPKAVEALVQGLKEYFPNRKFTFIMGVMRDKDYINMLRVLVPLAKEFILITPNHNRALSASTLEDELKKIFTGPTKTVLHVENAIDEIVKVDNGTEIFCILGTLYAMGEIKNYLRTLENWMIKGRKDY